MPTPPREIVDMCMASAGAAMIVAADGAIVCANSAARNLLALPKLPPGARLQDFAGDGGRMDAALATFTRTNAPLPANFHLKIQGEVREVRGNGCAIVRGSSTADTFLFLQFPHRTQTNRSFVALNQKIAELNREVAARRRTEVLLAGQHEVLQMMLRDAPLADVLQRLCVAVEQQSQAGALASILLLDGNRLRHGAAPSLPEEYIRAIDGVQIGAAAGSCGTAAFRATPVIVEDIEIDPLWADYRGPAAQAGLRACWSMPVLSSDGRVLATFATYYRQPRKPNAADWQVIDITSRAAAVAIERSRVEAERRSREEALRRKDEQLSAALAASATGTYRWNPSTNQMPYFDENLARLFGFESDEHLVPPADFHHRIHPDDQAHVIEHLLSTRNGSDLEMEYRVIHPDGSTHWLYDRGRYIDGEGCIVGACTDITARKLAEEAVRESEQQFRNMADGIPQLAWMTDPNGYIYWYNQRWYEYTGTTPEQMLGWGWQSVHDPKELPRVLAKWTAAVREGTQWEDSFPLRGADGEYRLFLSRAFPIRDSYGNVVRWFGTNTDISEHVKAQEALRRTEKLAAAGRLAASIAHEINNPLEAVTNLLYLVAQENGIPDRLKQYLTMADEELQRVAHIARQTLGFYKESTFPTRFLVSDILDEVVRLHGRKLNSKKITVERDYRDPGEILASRGELRQVFSNLVSNAIDATNGPGNLYLRSATFTSPIGERMLRISVADEGCGIASEHLTRIFEPFFTTKKDIGTGLGLWVTREIIEKLGGKMRVRSRVGEGTVFTVTLPASAAPRATLGQTNVG